MTITTNIIESIGKNNLAAQPDLVDASTPICVVDYVKDFKWLWDLENGEHPKKGFEHWLAQRKGKDATVIIGWDGMPSGNNNNNILRHVTPLDWALSISEGLLEQKDLPHLRIMIVDGFPNGFIGHFYGQGIFSIEMLDTIKAVMPWLRVGTLNEGENVLNNLVSDTFDSFKSLYNEGIQHQNQVRGLNYAWQGITASTGEGHSINNIVGPLLLLGDPVQANPLVGALWRRMQLLTGLEGNGQDDQGNGQDNQGLLLTKKVSWVDWKDDSWKKKLKHIQRDQSKLKLLLLDDQWQDGWGEVICKAVGAEYTRSGITESYSETEFKEIGSHQDQGICVKACNSALWLLGENGPLANTTDRRFNLRMDKSNERAQEILLLDLRLFSRQPVSKEAQFIENLLERVENLQNDRSGKLPWPGFNEDELQGVHDWVKAAKSSQSSKLRQHPDYHKAITLLPRLISLIDLSYPIILFSSTGRREIVEKFKEYGNILTGFEKPRLAGTQSDNIVPITASNFVNAFDRALTFLTVRCFCASLPTPKTFDLPEFLKGRWTIELYLDEDGSEINKKGKPSPEKHLRIGGLLALFPPSCNPEKFNDNLRGFLIKQRWLGEDGKNLLRKNIDKIYKFINKEIRNGRGPTHLSMVLLGGKMGINLSPGKDVGFLELMGTGDNLHRHLLSVVTEIATYHHAKRFCPEDADVSYNIFMPTRVLPSLGREHRKIMRERWGIRSTSVEDGSILLRYFDSDSARPLVQSIAQNYWYAGFRPIAEHARAYGLNKVFKKHGKEELSNVRMLHLLADAVLGNKKSNAAQHLMKSGFSGFDGPSLQAILYAQRNISNGYIGAGFARGVVAAAEACNENETDVSRLLAEDIYKIAHSDLMGTDFLYIVDNLRTDASTNMADLVQQKKGKITYKDSEKCIVTDEEGYEFEFHFPLKGIDIMGLGDQVQFSAKRGYIPGEWDLDVQSVEPNEAWDELDINQMAKGIVTNVFDNRVYLDINGIVGFFKRKNPLLTYHHGDEIQLTVSEINKGQRKLVLKNDQEYTSPLNTIQKGTVVNIVNFGAFIEFNNGATGLIHISKLASGFVEDPKQYVSLKDEVEVKVLSISREGKLKIDLQLAKNITRIEGNTQS